MPITITEAIHLVSSDSAAGHVKQATKLAGVTRHVRILGERLTIGPCDVDPKRHAELRRAWNARDPGGLTDTFGLDELRVAVAGGLPVVVWATRAYADLVWLWWILDGLARLGPLAHPPILVRPEADDPLSAVGGITPEAGCAALAVARTISDDEFREGAELWRLFSSPDPRAFDEARRRGSPVFPELHESAELHGAWFPRLEGGWLRLAEHDGRLLGGLTDRWLTPGGLSKRIVEVRGWERLMWPFGGYAYLRRLLEWAAHGVVEREVRDPDDDNPFERDVFRLTDRARSLLADGLESVGDAPPIYVGGCKLNDPTSPWVRISDNAAGWRIIPCT